MSDGLAAFRTLSNDIQLGLIKMRKKGQLWLNYNLLQIRTDEDLIIGDILAIIWSIMEFKNVAIHALIKHLSHLP